LFLLLKMHLPLEGYAVTRFDRRYSHINNAMTDPPGNNSSTAAYGPNSRAPARPRTHNPDSVCFMAIFLPGRQMPRQLIG